MTSPLTADTVSFGHVAENAEPLRMLIEYGAPNIWTERPVIPPKYFEKLMKEKSFNRTVKSIVNTVEGFRDTLRPIQLDILDMLKEYSKVKPDAHLDEIFQSWAPVAHKELYRLQQPIFKELREVAKELPDSAKVLFDRLMEKTRNQIQQKPIVQEFNKRDFRYKLERIAQRIRQRNISNEVEAMEKIITLAEIIPPNYKPRNLYNKRRGVNKYVNNVGKHNNRYKKDNYSNRDSQFIILRQMSNYFERSVLSKDEELQSLFADVSCQIQRIPIFIPFGRQNFMKSITNITNGIADKNLAQKMIQIASKIPTASKEISAFIVKASRKPSDKIAYDWLWGAVGNIEHLKCRSKGGKNKPTNYAVADNYHNSEGGNKPFAQRLREHPEYYESCEYYVKWLANAQNEGLLKKVGLNKGYVTNFANYLISMSPPEKPLKFNIPHMV